MKLKDFIINEAKKPSRVCEYLDSIGIEFEKTQNENGAKFDLIKSTPKETKNIVDDILNVPEITKHFNVGYGGGTTIVVEFGE